MKTFHRCRANTTCCHRWICIILELIFVQNPHQSHNGLQKLQGRTKKLFIVVWNQTSVTKEKRTSICHRSQQATSTVAWHNVSKRLQNVREPKPTQDCIAILGDSIVQNIHESKMKPAMNNDQNVYIKSFSGATVDCKLCLPLPNDKKESQDNHSYCDTNDLNSSQAVCNIPRGVINLVKTSETRSNSVIMSGSVPGRDFWVAK